MASIKLTKEETERISANDYKVKTIRVFVSYSSANKSLAGQIKRILEQYGLSVFLAHDDIPPLHDWQEEISNNLNECDVFIPILTHSFGNSKWTDQEIGMAFGLKKMIIPLKVDVAPYGFISKIQACKLDVDNPRRSCLKIINVLKDSQFKESLIDCLLRALEEAYDFDSATKVIKELNDFENFNEEQINHIIRVSIRNNQFRMCSTGKTFLRSITKKYASKIDSFLLMTYNKVKDRF